MKETNDDKKKKRKKESIILHDKLLIGRIKL